MMNLPPLKLYNPHTTDYIILELKICLEFIVLLLKKSEKYYIKKNFKKYLTYHGASNKFEKSETLSGSIFSQI